MRKINKFWLQATMIALSSILLTTGCTKESNIPVVKTTEITEITKTTAKSGGVISSDGGITISARGVCWSTKENPTIDDNKAEDGTGADRFTSSITGLEPNTTYYVRAYATNSAGTSYGRDMSFTTLEGISGSLFTDPRDGKVYQTVVIGNQEWMAKNLAYAPSSGNFWAYNNDDANVDIYGYLYDWTTANDVCPDGWHLPADAEWTELFNFLGGTSVAGGKLKETGTTHWTSPNAGATNETEFTALPGGILSIDGEFDSVGGFGFWWSATELFGSEVSQRTMVYYDNAVGRYDVSKTLGLSVRCIRD